MTTAVPLVVGDGGCPEAAGLTRRTFLRATAATAGAVSLSSVSVRYAWAADPAASPGTLVVLSLRGGFDGLTAFPAVGDPAYYAARPSIAVPASVAIPLDRTFGMHPALKALTPLWDAGKMSVVHAVGTPDASRSHFQAQEALENAAPGSSIRTGWLDRVLAVENLPSTFTATQVGSRTLPRSMAGLQTKMAVRSVDDGGLAARDWVGQRMETALAALHRGAPAHLAGAASTALSSLGTLASAKQVPAGSGYPAGDFGKALRDLARLIKAGIGLRVATLDLGDWDMHSGLGGVDDGWMARKLTELGDGLAAFAADLGPLLDTTTLVTLSEFGRRVAQNDSGGVDHGHGNAVLLLGGGLVGKTVHGQWNGLGASALDRGDLPGLTDYRDVLSDLLRGRLGLADTRSTFPGLDPVQLRVLA